MIQLITPNPDIPCTPGWCLAYVNEAYGVAKRYGTATAAWNNSPTQHPGRDVPAGVWTPVWYALANEPAGHVVLHAPDGTVYSTSDLTATPHHHPDLADLERYYAYYGMPLTWRGWTEDVEGTPVIAPDGITAQGTTTTPLEDIMAISPDDLKAIADAVHTRPAPIPAGGYNTLEWSLGAERARNNEIIAAAVGAKTVSAQDIAGALSPQLAADLLAELTKRVPTP